jgi:hypothetical protein
VLGQFAAHFDGVGVEALTVQAAIDSRVPQLMGT